MKDQFERLCFGADVISTELLREKMERGRPLVVKFGVDPTRPDIHLGHTVVLRKMRIFQELGHQVVFLIGDFTARIGDPTGRSETRPVLSAEEIERNAKTYMAQVGRILDASQLTVRFNSEWLSPLSFADVLSLAASVTVARILERDDFAKRYASEQAIHLSEFMYPLMQGYDSVALKADVEMGGVDQRFNILLARQMQRAFDLEPQVAFLMPILPGLDGVQKMSKSLDNYVGIDETPDAMFGKLMSLPDDQIGPYFRLLSDIGEGELGRLERGMTERTVNPRDAKLRLARTIVADFHGEAAAEAAQESFLRVFSRRQLPDEMPVHRIGAGETILAALVAASLVSSSSDARRLLAQGAVELDGEKIKDKDAPAHPGILRVGKHRFLRLVGS